MLGGSVLLGGAGIATAASNGTDLGAGFMTGVFLGSAAGAVLSMGIPAIIAGTKSVGDKLIADMATYASFGKAFGGLIKGIGFSKIQTSLLGVFLRPTIDQFITVGMREKQLDPNKYQFDIINRGLTEFLSGPLKPVFRGLNSGWYDANKGNIAFTW